MTKKSKSGGDGGMLLLMLLVGLFAAGYSQADPAKGDQSEYAAPIDGWLSSVTSEFGPRGDGMHYGVDVSAPLGEPIYAVAAGVVVEAGPATGFGLWVRIEHGDGTVTVYGHMHTITVDQGERVDAGEQIATVGSRGQSTGPHLHLEVWPDGERAARVDPEEWLAERGVHV